METCDCSRKAPLFRIASIIGSGINGNYEPPSWGSCIIVSLLLLEVELMETSEVQLPLLVLELIASIIGSGINGNLNTSIR